LSAFLSIIAVRFYSYQIS